MSNPWRYECPNGHRDVRKRHDSMHSPVDPSDWYCKTCGQGYDSSQVTDLQTA